MSTFWQIIIAVLGAGGLTSLIQFFVNRHDKKKGSAAKIDKDIEDLRKEIADLSAELKEQKSELGEQKEDAIVMMHDRIYQSFNHLKHMKKIGTIDRCNIDYLAERYFLRGGNHKAELMYEQIKKIPVVDDEDLKRKDE